MKFANAHGTIGNGMLLGKQSFFPDASLGGGLKDYAFYTNSTFKDLISGQPLQTTLDAGRPLPDNSGNVAGLNEPVLGENGIYSYGPYTHIDKFSEDLSNAVWSKTECSSIDNAIIPSANNALHYIKQSINTITNSKVSFSVDVKAGASNTVYLRCQGSTTRTGFFNLDTNVFSTGSSGITGTFSKSSIEGYKRITLSFDIGSDNISDVRLYAVPSNTISESNRTFAGDGSTVYTYATNFQLTESPYALPYIKTEDSQVSVPINYSDANGGYKWPINSVDTPLLLDALDGKADGSLENSGSLVSTNRYQVVTTETDHFGTGVVAGDRITGQTTALDANNTVKQISPAQGEMQVEWVPGFNYSDRSTGATACILSCHNNYRPLYLHYSVQNRIQIYDGTTPVYKDINFQAGTKYTINAVWGTHPTEGANKMQLFVTDGITNWQSNVVDFDGSFNPTDYLNVGWGNEYYQAIKSIKFYKEPKHWT